MGNQNGNGFASKFFIRLFVVLTILTVVILGAGLGWAVAETANTRNNENFVDFAPALPTRLLDIEGTLITQYSADEKRELVSLSELPRHLIHAVLAREDPDFYNHRGFSIRAITRAAWGQVTGIDRGGGSTITQQVAGTLYTDRTERTLRRKLIELWWAFQLERRYTKNEILEIYLNYMPMGPGTYGVETTSKYFFGHSASDVTLAEGAALAVMLSGPGRFNPIVNPNLAMDRQRFVLDRMVEFGYTTPEEADYSFNDYWVNFDWTRASVAAYFTREDRAPWFSEYVRRELDSLMYGTMDYYRDGYVIHTTLNLDHQAAADRIMAQTLEKANIDFLASNRGHFWANRTVIPIVNLLTLAFNITDIRNASVGQNQIRAASRYDRLINPIVDLASLAFDITEVRDLTAKSYAQHRVTVEQTSVEGALITIENETGYITAMVGGSEFDENNQFIRATQGTMQPGSAYKTLYFSAALDTRRFTPATMIYDAPVVFFNDDGSPYIPSNYGGIWRGPVLMYNVHALSLNIPSMIILDTIGFDAAIQRSAALMGISNPVDIRRIFPRVYPLALGVHSTSPLQMARAFAVFGNQGREVTPIAIRSIEDRNGRVIFDLERDLRLRQRRENVQVVSPQNAYVMARMMERTVDLGTLRFGSDAGAKFTYADETGRTFRMPIAVKTGTTQNWADGWVVGSSPYLTTAIWIGFDRPGNSLGVEVAGATLVGPPWSDYMREIHQGLTRRDFIRPPGVVYATVCARSGLAMNRNCNQGARTLAFLAGTVPGRVCNMHGAPAPFGGTRMPTSNIPIGSTRESQFINTLSVPQLQLDLFPDLMGPPGNQPNRTPIDSFDNEQDIPRSHGTSGIPGVMMNNPDDENFNSLTDQGFEGLPSWNPLE